MNKIKYINGDATDPQLDGKRIIAHVCNDVGGWGKGFVMAISMKWKEPEANYREWYRNRSLNNFKLGAIQLVEVGPNTHIANMIGQRGIKTSSDGPPIRYDAIETCLKELAQKAEQMKASVHMPRIGCGLAGGTWERIQPLIEKTLISKNIETIVYDFN